MNTINSKFEQIIRNALDEDIGSGDVTTNSTVSSDIKLVGNIIAKESGIIAGIEIAKQAFALSDKQTEFNQCCEDGDLVHPNFRILEIKGNGRALLSGERVVLNLMQRMSGIATLTKKFVDKIDGTKAKILDTRKTMPGLRIFDKWAVRIGGGNNHRFGLYDMALIKENHITAAGSITKAIQKVRSGEGLNLLIEVEVKNIEELEEALPLKVDRILLDNMSLFEMSEAVRLTNNKIPLEASGNVNLDNVRNIAETGVDFISVGMLTHSAKALDLSLIIN